MRIELYADVAFINGTVITVNAKDEIKQAVAVKDNKIVYVGDNEGIKEWIHTDTKVIDLKGKTLMPGFIEAHSHFMLASILLNDTVIPIDYRVCDSIEMILKKVSEAVQKTKPGEWIVLQGYDQNKLKERRHPHYKELDEAAPNNPVWCVRADLHTGVCNSLALQKAGWTKESASKFQPGELQLDDKGELTGLLKEECFGYMNSLVSWDDDKLMEAYQLADAAFLKEGITSVHDAGAYGGQFVKNLQTACQKRLVHLRIYEMIYRMLGKYSIRDFIYEHIKVGLHTGLGDEHFRLGPAKMLIDGSSSAPSCALKQPFSHDSSTPMILNWTQEEMESVFLAAHRAGFQITAHCIGDRAIEQMVNTIEKVMTQYPREDARPRIEHCAIIDETLLKRIKALGIIPISNPGLVAFNAKDYNKYYGERAHMMFSHKSYLEEGILAAAGADAPCMPVSPLLGIWAALTRKDILTGEICGENQRIDLLSAIRMFTYNGAYASFEESIKGNIEEGKLADLIVLSEDITTCEVDRIKDLTVEQTYVDGELVYAKEG